MNPEEKMLAAGGQIHADAQAEGVATGAPAPLWYDDGAWDEKAIPARPWLAKGYLIRGSVTAVVGPGGISKSSLMVSWAVHLALGMECHGMKPMRPFRVMVYNVEDDHDEQRRRLSGVLTGVGKKSEDIAGKIARIGPSSVGTLIDRGNLDEAVDTEVMAEIERRIVLFRPDILILDPLAELHSFEENDNTALRSVIARFRALASTHNIAVVLLHHTRKGVVQPGDADATRGASSIVSAARVVLTVTSMTDDDVKAFGLPTGSKKSYFRVDGGKSNYASLTNPEWFERIPYILENGDAVATVAPWFPPVDTVTPAMMEIILTGIAEGSPQGPWSAQLRNNPRSVKNLFVNAGITTSAGHKAALDALIRAGCSDQAYKGKDRKLVNGLRSLDGKPTGVDWENAIVH